jgi:LysM repeat protein
MKKFLLAFFLLPFLATAQNGKLMIQGTAGNLYLQHTTAPKENFYSIGRLYNISPKEYAPYNKLVLEKGLSLGQVVKIPLISNFIQEPGTAADEVAVPLYHKALPKETLLQISTHYNKVSLASLREWNNMKTDEVTAGQDIIVGYLKVKKDLSAFAQQAVAIPAAKEDAKAVVITKKEPVAPATPPAEAKPAKETPMMKVEPVAEKKITPIAEAPKTVSSGKDFKEGVFKSLYTDGGKEQAGKAGIFKSTSGREDGKYYCLQNTAPPGTVVKITNGATGKTIYAKVLDMMPDLKQNAGLAILLSDAAADALGGGTDLICTINY